MSSRRDPDNQPILDANDMMWWGFLGVVTGIPMMVVGWMGWPVWAAFPVALLLGLALSPLVRRQARKLESQRPHPLDE